MSRMYNVYVRDTSNPDAPKTCLAHGWNEECAREFCKGYNGVNDAYVGATGRKAEMEEVSVVQFKVTATHSNPALCFDGVVTVRTDDNGYYASGDGLGCGRSFASAHEAIRSLFRGSMSESQRLTIEEPEA